MTAMTPDDIDDTIKSATATLTAEPIRMTTDVERMLATVVDYLANEVGALRYALAGALQQLGMERALDGLYQTRPLPDGSTYRAAPVPLIPTPWLREMARSGRSLAQVAGSSDEAAEVLARIENDWKSSR